MRFQLLSIVILGLIAIEAAAPAARAEEQCLEEYRLVAQLRRQVRELTAEKQAANRSLNELDAAENDADVLYGRNMGENITLRAQLESRLRSLTEGCKAEHGHGPSCEGMTKTKKDLMQLSKMDKKNDSRDQAWRTGLKNAQNGKAKESLEIEIDLRDAQSDLDTASRDLEECKSQSPSAYSAKTAGSGGWNSF